jgi:uncharacterized glyoxalase superfamily protein PhnB
MQRPLPLATVILPGVSYVEPTQQLVVELCVRDLGRAFAFYRALGFASLRLEKDFAVLTWEGHQLFLEETPHLPPADAVRANVRVMVPDVDARWHAAQALGARVVEPLADRAYGLRDFTIADPDGHGVRFGTFLPGRER